MEVKSVGVTKTIDGLGPLFRKGLGVRRPLEDKYIRSVHARSAAPRWV